MTPLFLRFNACEVTLSGFATGEYLPLPASKGPAFPSRSPELTTKPFSRAQAEACSPSMGTPLLQQITLRNNEVPLRKVRKLQ